MQRRLFVLFLLLSLIPAATILAVNWQISQRHLGFLDSPGLRESLESSLDLARAELNDRMKAALDELDRLMVTATDDVLPEPGGEDVLILVGGGGIHLGARLVVGDE